MFFHNQTFIIVHIKKPFVCKVARIIFHALHRLGNLEPSIVAPWMKHCTVLVLSMIDLLDRKCKMMDYPAIIVCWVGGSKGVGVLY